MIYPHVLYCIKISGSCIYITNENIQDINTRIKTCYFRNLCVRKFINRDPFEIGLQVHNYRPRELKLYPTIKHTLIFTLKSIENKIYE